MIKVLQNSPVFSTGAHCAFTDLTFFKNRFFLSFRQGSAHMSPDGVFCLMESPDGVTWSQPRAFPELGVDVRDTKLLTTAQFLFAFFPVRETPRKPEKYRSFYSKSTDGRRWTRPKPFLPANWVVFRVRQWRNALYGLGFYHHADLERWEVGLFQMSPSAKKWLKTGTLLKGQAGNETDVFFAKNSILSVIRREGQNSLLLKSSLSACLPERGRSQSVSAQAGGFPLKWKKTILPFAVHAPCMAEVSGKLLLAGRKFTLRKIIPGAALTNFTRWREEVIIWEKKQQRFVEAVKLCEDEDCGYCGMALDKNNPGTAWVSYYKGTTEQADIWLAKIQL